MLTPAKAPAVFELSVLVLTAALVLHIGVVAIFGRLPRALGWLFLAAYGVFLWKGLPG
jgi:hypothetical protein